MKTPAEQRYRNARRAGARSFNREEWDALVKRAAEHEHARMSDWCVLAPDAPRQLPRWDRQLCGPGQVPIDLRTILAIEARLAECEMLHDKLVELGANEDLSLAMREKLRGTLKRALTNIEARIKQEQRSHLSVVDDG